jgi:hypothetical protein
MTHLTLAEKESIFEVKKVLADFYLISGLKCNFEKSLITFIGPKPDCDWIAECGFVQSDSFKLLGVQFSNNLAELDRNFDNCYNKIRDIIRFWARFNLTLPARIAISKTYMFQQLNHFGCIYMPSDFNITRIQKSIDDFCVGPLNVSTERLYLSPEKGGLGLFEIRPFLTAQHVVWLKRAELSTRDNWRFNFSLNSYGNCFTTDPDVWSPQKNPILHGLAVCWKLFYTYYLSTNSNYKFGYLLNNPLFNELEKNFFLNKTLVRSRLSKYVLYC